MQPLCSDVFFAFGRCSRFPAPPALRASGAEVFFFFFREKKRDVLFFLFFQEKKRKNQRKETLTGWGMSVPHRAALLHHSFTVFPCGAFLKESPAKYFLRGRQAPLTGGRSGCFRGGFMAFALVLFSPPERKENEERERKERKKHAKRPRRGGRAGAGRVCGGAIRNRPRYRSSST